jgi:hypothetical protein
MHSGQMKYTTLLALLASCTVSCGGQRELALGVVQIGSLDTSKLTESSGLVASRQYTNVFWTHNDGGKKETLFAISREGKILAEFKVADVKFDDWEDIAIDSEGLYLSDTGDNTNKRKKVAVVRVPEPDPSTAQGNVRPSKQWELRWPKTAVDCEALFVHGKHGYLTTKVKNDRPAEVYRFQLDGADSQVLELVARLTIDSPVTGADIAPNGAAVAFVAGNGAYGYRIDGDVSKLAQVRPWHTRFRHQAVEACTFTPDGLLATAETGEVILFTDQAFRVLR